MSDMINEYKLESYEKKSPLGNKGTMWIVEETVKRKRFVMRELPATSQKVYQILKELHHPNIIEIIDVFSCHGFCYVIEEYLDWELLSDRIAVKKLSKHQVRSVAKQLLQALILLHEHDIVHKDIKPENIMIDSFGNIKLIDFDIAHLFSEDKTKDTTLKGSKDYAPPEQFGFSQSDCRTDIYALGVTLNELAAGELPEKKLCHGRMRTVVKRCIEFDPKRRYQTAAQALRHIRRQERGIAGFLAVIVISLILSCLAVYLPKDQTPSLEKLSEHTSYYDRIISIRQAGEHPSILLCDGEPAIFTTDLGTGKKINIFAKQNKEKLYLSCTLEEGESFEYHFEDVFADWYKDLGYSINTDIEKTSPEYEIMQCDIDQDGIEEIFIAFSWRRYIETFTPGTSYYLTEYSIVWELFQKEEGQLSCSDPLGFEGCLPELENGGIFYESLNTMWYTWDKEKESWKSLY